jgi:uncharacterized protein YjgD (DUF1641 family)
MENEELILAKLENLESQIEPMVKFAQGIKELKDDIIPLQNIAIQVFIKELQDVEAGFNLDDFIVLIKQSLRSTNDLLFAMKSMSSMIEFARDVEPLMKSAVPQLIEYLDEMEQKGVFRMMKAMLDMRAKVAAAYDHEDIEQIGDVMVTLLGLTKKLSDPKALDFLEKAAAIPAHADLANSKKMGPFKLMAAGFDDEIKDGLGVMIELTKAMSVLKGGEGKVGNNTSSD